MARPTPSTAALVNGIEAWDAVLKAILDAILTNPYPAPQFADFASLPAASSFDRCMACTIDTNKLYFSNGTVWKEVSFV